MKLILYDNMEEEFIIHKRNNKWGIDYIFMEKNGNAVGRLYIYYDDNNTAYIEGLHVSDKVRRKRIGTRLLNKILTKAKKHGALKCMLWCSTKEWVYKWYERLGFNYYSNYDKEDNSVWLIKEL